MSCKISPTAITTNEQAVYYLLTEDEALNEMTIVVRQVNDILSLLSTTLVRLILNHFRWDKNTLTEKFYENPEELFQTLNVANPYLSPSLQWNPLSPGLDQTVDPMLAAIRQTTDQGNVTCRTCCVEQPSAEFHSLRCRHQHCKDCWRGYLQVNIFETGCGRPIYCLSRCVEVIDDEQILDLLSFDDALRARYQRFLVDAFVESNRLTHYCPGSGCSMIVKMKTYTPNCAQLIECDKCCTDFCFQCLRPWHEPVQCAVLQKWEKKNQDESMTGQWMMANTKECPKCHSSIEKNGGCNHMTCRKPGCGHEFCWLCFKNWSGHQQCNVYQQEELERDQSEAREILARYMHYYTRYQTHDQSLRLEENLREKVKQQMKDMQAMAMSYTDQQSLSNAFVVLQRCRRTLKYTYAFAYYLVRNNLSEIFEQNQADLEQATEVLSGLLEREITADRSAILELMNKTSYCEQRRKTLVDHCKDGYSNSYWRGLDAN